MSEEKESSKLELRGGSAKAARPRTLEARAEREAVRKAMLRSVCI